MKFLIALIFLFCAFSGSVLFAKAGGSGSNGTGGKSTYDGVSVLGPLEKLLGQKTKSADLPEAIGAFKSDFPDGRFDLCEGKAKFQLPLLPQKYSGTFLFFADDGDKVLPLTSQQICSSQWVAAAYMKLLYSIYKIASEGPVGDHLFQKTVQLGGPIKVVLEKKPTDLGARVGTIEEYTWFDSNTGLIHWALDKSTKIVFTALYSRTDSNMFTHEVVHLLTLRATGNRYPKDTIWHDRSQGVWYELHTSVEAAFVEGLADALEAPSGENFDLGGNPYILLPGDFNSLHKGSSGFYCFWQKEAYQDKGNQVLVPLQDEVYVASTINTLFVGESPEAAPSDEYGPIKRNSVGMTEPMIQMIDAVAAKGPLSVLELAKAIDEQTGGQTGYTWLREFYFTDYKKMKSTRDELFVGNIYDSSDQKGLCVPHDKESLFFTPLRDAAWDELVKKEELRYVQTISVPDAIATGVNQFNQMKAASDAVSGELARLESQRETLLARTGACTTKNQDVFKGMPVTLTNFIVQKFHVSLDDLDHSFVTWNQTLLCSDKNFSPKKDYELQLLKTEETLSYLKVHGNSQVNTRLATEVFQLFYDLKDMTWNYKHYFEYYYFLKALEVLPSN